MVQLQLVIDDRTKEALNSSDEAVQVAIVKAMLRSLLRMEGAVAKEVVATTADGDPQGVLSNSFQTELLEKDGTGVAGRVFSALPYARIQNDGGVIRPKNAKWLTIPVDGLPVGARARDYPELKFIPLKGRSPVLAKLIERKKGALPEIKVFFVLKKRVVLEGKHFIERATEAAGEKVNEMFRAEIAEALNA